MRIGQCDWVSLGIPQPCGFFTYTVNIFYWGIIMSCVLLGHDATQYVINVYLSYLEYIYEYIVHST